MKQKKKQNNQKEASYTRVMVTTSPQLAGLTTDEMTVFVGCSLQDSLLPKIIHVLPTDKACDRQYKKVSKDPYWQAQFRQLSEGVVRDTYQNVLPIIAQPQDYGALHFYMKLEGVANFKSITQLESDVPIAPDSRPPVFWGLHTEAHLPQPHLWDDIDFDAIGIVGKDNFERFVQIMLDRLKPIIKQLWRSNTGYSGGVGLDERLVRNTYLHEIHIKSNDLKASIGD